MKNVAALPKWLIATRASAWLAGLAAQSVASNQTRVTLDRDVAPTLLTSLHDLTAVTQTLVDEVRKAHDVAAASETAFRIHATDMKQAMTAPGDDQQRPRTAYPGMLSDTHTATAPSQPTNRRIHIDYTTSDFGEILAAARLLRDDARPDVGAHVAYAALAYSRQIIATHNHHKDRK